MWTYGEEDENVVRKLAGLCERSIDAFSGVLSLIGTVTNGRLSQTWGVFHEYQKCWIF